MSSVCKVIRHCMDCPVRGSSRLCDVPADVLRDIDAEKQQVSYPAMKRKRLRVIDLAAL